MQGWNESVVIGLQVLAKQLMTVRHLSQNLLLPQPQYLFDLRSFLLPAIQAAGGASTSCCICRLTFMCSPRVKPLHCSTGTAQATQYLCHSASL